MRQVLIAGDSTVVDRNSNGNYNCGVCYTGWGQMLPLHIGPLYKVKNYAVSGLTTDTFRSQGHYAKLLSNLKEDDYVLFQFGHNDEKLPSLLPNVRYKENLKNYINEIQNEKGIPVLITPLARNSWNCESNTYNDLLEEYAKVVMEVGAELDVLVVDLHDFSKKWIIENGRENVKLYFHPGDFTHTNDYGANFFATYVAKKLENYINPKKLESPWYDTCPSKVPKFLYEEPFQKLTVKESYKIVRILGAYFAKNEIVKSNRDEELISAEQNGYLILNKNLDDFITEEEFVNLLYVAMSGRENLTNINKKFENKDTITRKTALEYILFLEDKLNYKKIYNEEISGS